MAKKSLEERFWEKVDKKSPDECWEWKNSIINGYGTIKLNGKNKLTHRLSYELNVGPIPPGLFVCHTCDNPKCVNPTHLFLGTQKDNLQDASKKGRIASGNLHYSRTHPELLARGDCHWCKTHPESYLGEKNGNAKLTENQVKEIRQLYARGSITLKELGMKFGAGLSTIGYIVNHKTWKHIQ
jgi:hypothetical protein